MSVTSYITRCTGQFSYLDSILGHPAWQGKMVLDFGGNNGNLLSDQNSTIDHDKYWCIDVSKDAIDEGQQKYPKANFLFYNRYNFGFNPAGIKELPLPKIEQKFDYIFSISALATDIPSAEMLEFIPNLNRWLKDDGALLFTFIHPHHIPEGTTPTNLQHFGGREKLDHLTEGEKHALWYTVSAKRIYVESNVPDEDDKEGGENELFILYTPEYIRSLFPYAEVAAPVRPLTRSHCCILRKRSFVS
jgi:SAM-dependent methyltransferase